MVVDGQEAARAVWLVLLLADCADAAVGGVGGAVVSAAGPAPAAAGKGR